MKERSFLVETTNDGSHTLFIPELDEHYHSTNGAIQESQHIYIDAGLRNLIQKKTISILEIGFGTGLNAYLTLCEGQDLFDYIDYTSFELYPLPKEIYDCINYSQLIPSKQGGLFQKLHRAEWNRKQEITSSFCLTKIESDFTRLTHFSEQDMFDLVYFDAFAPNKQADMWTQEIFDYLCQHTNEGGVLVTYCAKGEVRRMMQRAGYNTERLAGPKGKREILRSVKK